MNVSRTAVLGLALAGAAAAQEEIDPQLRYARIEVPETQPRCFASPRSPVYEDRLTEGQVVRVGRQEGDFRLVVLPTGVTGYVHKRFTSEPVDGKVRANASDVSFRYRPRSSEAPAQLLPEGTELLWIGEQDDWWVVRYSGAPAYLPEEAVEVFDEASPTLADSHGDLAEARKQAWQRAVLARAEALAAEEKRREQETALDALASRFREAAARPIEEQDFGALEADLTALSDDLPEEGVLRVRAEALGKEIERQQLLARALEVVQEEPPTVDRAAELLEPEVVDPLSRFHAMGWLHYETPLGGVPRVVLRKGGQLLFELTCSSGRYDLRVFDGAEVGVTGAKSRPNPDSVRTLDVLRLEVLRLPR